MHYRSILLAACAALSFPVHAQADAPANAGAQKPILPVERYSLPNGLDVVFHIDRSDPVVAVVLAAHVGSAREEPGRTGFAHMFEHLFFLNSENLGPGGLDAMGARIGGSGANGSTDRDITDYLQTVPNDALEKMIWAEADKLGYFINTVTDPVLAKEKQVVKNEKRQSYDNQPYGQTEPIMVAALYPKDHPYSWPVIGSLADLDAAKLDDVKSFYRRWYVPNNATLVIAGDFDTAQARKWVEKYFGEIPRGADVARPAPRAAGLAATKTLVHEDNFAQLPELTIAWPTVNRHHPDEMALVLLFDLLTDGKDAPLTKLLIDERKLTAEVQSSGYDSMLAGEQYLTVRAFEGVTLDTVQAAIDEGLKRFENAGVDPAALARVKTASELSVYNQLGSVLGKARQIARYDVLAGRPDYLETDLAQLRAVTADDIMRVYRSYVAGKPHIALSTVPRGKTALALAGSAKAEVVEEAIVQGAEAEVDAKAGAGPVTRTASSFDRTVEPPAGAAPVVKTPPMWNRELSSGLVLSGIVDRELPLAQFELVIDGGRLFDKLEKPGAANLLARMMTRGTAKRTTAELENAFKALGAEVNVSAQNDRFVVQGRTLSRNFAPTMALVTEIVLQPRWDVGELGIVKAAIASEIQTAKAEPSALAQRAFATVTYGPTHIWSKSALGTEASVKALTMDDLRAFHANNLAPNIARFGVVGDVDQAAVTQALSALDRGWKRHKVSIPQYPAPKPLAAPKLYFYDMPDAKQSTFAFGAPALRRADPDFYPATVANYILGGGGFASRLTKQLREGKGYTYGIFSNFAGANRAGTFLISSPVRSNVTLEAAQLVRSIVTDYGPTFTEADLAVTKAALSKSKARAFETAGAKLGLLANIGEIGLPADYLEREDAVIDGMTVEGVRALAAKYLRADAINYVIVGDAATQAKRLEGLGLGAPEMIAPAALE